MAPTTLREYKKQAAERQKRWRASQKEKGLKRVSFWLDKESEQILNNAISREAGTRQEALTTVVTRLLRESSNVTDNATRIESLETENARLTAELTAAQARISALESQGEGERTATREKPPESSHGTAATEVLAIAKPLREQGMTSKQIATALNDQGIKTLSGRGQWTTNGVNNLFSRYG